MKGKIQLKFVIMFVSIIIGLAIVIAVTYDVDSPTDLTIKGVAPSETDPVGEST